MSRKRESFQLEDDAACSKKRTLLNGKVAEVMYLLKDPPERVLDDVLSLLDQLKQKVQPSLPTLPPLPAELRWLSCVVKQLGDKLTTMVHQFEDDEFDDFHNQASKLLWRVADDWIRNNLESDDEATCYSDSCWYRNNRDRADVSVCFKLPAIPGTPNIGICDVCEENGGLNSCEAFYTCKEMAIGIATQHFWGKRVD